MVNFHVMEGDVDLSDARRQIAIRPAQASEAGELAKILIDEVSWGRLPELGLAFNTLLHRHFIDSRYAICLVAEREGEILGYGAGLTDTRAFHRDFILRKGLRAGVLLLPYLLKWRNLQTIIRALTYFPEAPKDDPPAEIACLNVRHRYQKLKLGTKIFFALMESYKVRNIKSVKIGHVDPNKKHAVAFWESLGTRYLRSERFYRHNEVRVYAYDIPDS